MEDKFWQKEMQKCVDEANAKRQLREQLQASLDAMSMDEALDILIERSGGSV